MKHATQDQIIAWLRQGAMLQRTNQGITYEDGVKLVDLVAHHGDKIATAWEASIYMAREIEKLRAAIKPFADLAGKLEGAPNLVGMLTEEDFRQAAAVLARAE